MSTAALRCLLSATAYVAVPTSTAQAQVEEASESVTVWPVDDGQAVVYKSGLVCPGNVAVSDTAATFEGTFTTTSTSTTPYEVVFTFGSADGMGELEGTEPTTTIGSWDVTSEEGTTTARLAVGVSSAQPLAWTFGLIGLQPGLAFYTWQIRVRGDLRTDESCTFEIIVLPGRLVGQVLSEDANGVFGLDGVEVTLFDMNGDSVRSTVTRPFEFDGMEGIDPATERGWYFFNGLPPGKYTIRVRLKGAHEPKTPDDEEPEVDIPSGEEITRIITTVPIEGLDWGDLPRPWPDDAARCPGPGGPFRCYPTLVIDDGARHGVSRDVGLGDRIDAETDGQPDDDAFGDGGDEDGVYLTYFPTEGGQGEIVVETNNFSDDQAYLHVWFDFNGNGILGDTPQELVVSEIVPAQSGASFIRRDITVPPVLDADVYFRARITTDPTASAFPRPFGLYIDGEVEDYLDFNILNADFGDAPDEEDPTRPDIPAGYPTRFQDDGARHAMSPSAFFGPDAVFLGRLIDPDDDGEPTLDADGDDRELGQANDEDGIVFADGFTPFRSTGRPGSRGAAQFIPAVAPGDSATIIPLATVDGLLDAWFDWNRDGQWQEDERVFRNEPIDEVPNETPLRLKVPDGASEGFTFARFRYRIAGDVEVTGVAPNGEVEDYILMVTRVMQVANTGDDGPGSLRQAILDANQAPGVQVIRVGDLAAAAAKSQDPILLESPLPEITDAVIIDGGGTTIIDGTNAGSDANGLAIQSAGTVITGLTVQNFSGHGILIDNAESGDEDGGPVGVNEGVILGNGRAGIRVSAESARPGPTISGNRIFGNAGLAIDHSNEGVTLNGGGGAGGGFPDYPIVSSAVSGSTVIEGTFSGAPESVYVVEFFASVQCDPSGFGEAEFVLGATVVATDAGGIAGFSVEFDTTIANQHVVTATATGPDGTTSELSQCTSSVGLERLKTPDLPDAFRLGQNYPNPFNPTTTVSVDVPEQTSVRLEVFDALGRLVAVPLAGRLSAGRYVTSFKATGLPSGVYYYRLIAGSFVQTRSMVLLE